MKTELRDQSATTVTPMFSEVIVGVDGTTTSRRAAARAAGVARAVGADLDVVTAVDTTVVQPAAVAVPMMAFEAGVPDDATVADAQRVLDEVADVIGAEGATRRVHGGSVTDALCGSATASSLVVVGNRRTQGAARVLGSVATSIIRAAPCDVLVVDSTRDVEREGVIVGVDRSDSAAIAARRAADLAAALDTWLHVVMCVGSGRAVDVAVGSDRFHADPVGEADDFLRDVRRQLGTARVTTSVGDGRPGRSICQHAAERGAGTVVVGNRGVHGAGRVLGSVAMDVVHHAPCDVYVARTTDR